MAEAKPTQTTLPALANHLKSCQTVTDLFKLANSDEFKAQARALPPEQLTELRATYRDAQTHLDGKVKLETFDGQVLLLVNVEWWHSDTFDNDGVTLHIKPERDPSHKFKALTSSAPIVRFCNRFANDMPTAEHPARILVQLVPVKDAERARQGQKIWTIKQLPAPQDAPSGSPF